MIMRSIDEMIDYYEKLVDIPVGRVERKKNISTVLIYVALIIGSIIMIFPFIWMILTGSKKSLSVSLCDIRRRNFDSR